MNITWRGGNTYIEIYPPNNNNNNNWRLWSILRPQQYSVSGCCNCSKFVGSNAWLEIKLQKFRTRIWSNDRGCSRTWKLEMLTKLGIPWTTYPLFSRICNVNLKSLISAFSLNWSNAAHSSVSAYPFNKIGWPLLPFLLKIKEWWWNFIFSEKVKKLEPT